MTTLTNTLDIFTEFEAMFPTIDLGPLTGDVPAPTNLVATLRESGACEADIAIIVGGDRINPATYCPAQGADHAKCASLVSRDTCDWCGEDLSADRILIGADIAHCRA